MYICARGGFSAKPTVVVNNVQVPTQNVSFDAKSGYSYIAIDDSTARVTFDGAVGEFYELLGVAPETYVSLSQKGDSAAKGLFGSPIVDIAGQKVDTGAVAAGLLISKVL